MPHDWHLQARSRPILDDESRVILCHSDNRTCEFNSNSMRILCNNPLAFQQHDRKLGHARYSCIGWLWTHQQITHETSADGCSCGACMPTCGGNGHGQESVWGIDLDVLGDMLLNALGPWGQRHDFQTAWSAPPWFWTPQRKLFRRKMRGKAWSSFGVIVFNRCPRSPWVRLLLSRTQRRAF